MKRIMTVYLRPYVGIWGLSMFFMLLASGLTAAFAMMVEPIIDDVLGAGTLGRVWFLGSSIFAIFLLRGWTTYMHTVLMNRTGQSVVADIQRDLFGHFMTLDLKFFHTNPSGQLISRVINDVNVMRTAVTESLTGIGKSFLTLIFLIGVMFHQDWILASCVLIIFPLGAGFVAWVGHRLRKMSGRIQDDMASLSDKLSQIFQGIRLVKAYGMEDHEKTRAGAAIVRVRDLVIKSVHVGNLSTPFNELLIGIVVFGIIVYGGYKVNAGGTTAGELMSFITAFTLAYEPMKKLAKMNNNIQTGMGAADRVFAMMDIKAAVVNGPNAVPVVLSQPEIVFDAVEFQYDNDEKKALDRVSFIIPSGKVTALVGRSGSGKTTIMNLIPRLFDVTGGRILIDGKEIQDIEIESLRRNIALVSQEITIFDDTVWANIGYGKTGAFRDEIIKAAMAAEADEFIRTLPHGYDTRLGEEGLKLSGGQRQRISIARAILRDAPILLLDEATSALDNEAERAIQNTLSELQVGRTTLVIAHRLSTVQNADQILVLEDGQLAESGRHEDLLQRNGTYARIYGAGLA
jgi:subfamily B ATP-binding cassette protein MsbA